VAAAVIKNCTTESSDAFGDSAAGFWVGLDAGDSRRWTEAVLQPVRANVRNRTGRYRMILITKLDNFIWTLYGTPNVRVDRAARFHAIPMYRVHARFDAKHPDSSRLRSNPDMSALDNIGADHNDALAKSLTEVSCTENLFRVSRISMTSPRE